MSCTSFSGVRKTQLEGTRQRLHHDQRIPRAHTCPAQRPRDAVATIAWGDTLHVGDGDGDDEEEEENDAGAGAAGGGDDDEEEEEIIDYFAARINFSSNGTHILNNFSNPVFFIPFCGYFLFKIGSYLVLSILQNHQHPLVLSSKPAKTSIRPRFKFNQNQKKKWLVPQIIHVFCTKIGPRNHTSRWAPRWTSR